MPAVLAFALIPLIVLGAVHAMAQELQGPIAEVRAGNARVELHRELGPCVGSARWALFIEDKIRVPGCWLLSGESVQIAWFDGSASVIPARAFREPKVL